MKIRLAGGVVTDGRGVWVPRSPAPVHVTHDAPPGAPVALGPAEATDEQVRHAVDELTRLVRDGGVVAAGAHVDLGEGFRSARLDGARGDQRDAVLAALRVLGLEGAGRLGDRAGFLVALFGPAVTKRVGAAAARAIGEGRWAALHLAVAASDALGPEQVEQVLALRTPDGVDLTPHGPPSALAQHLRQVLEPVPRPRRAELVRDLWAEVIDHHAARARAKRRPATQSRRDRTCDLRVRRRHDDDDLILSWLRGNLGRDPSLADAARWTPPGGYWSEVLARHLQDALAATALLRTAVAVADHGLEEGLARSAALIRAADAQTARVAARPNRMVPGLTGLPAHPVAYVHDLQRRLTDGGPRDAKFAAYVRTRLASARDYAKVIITTSEELLGAYLGPPEDAWAAADLRSWREGAGYGPARPPAAWDGIPAWTVGAGEPLSRRLAASPDSAPADVEVVGDLLWYADLVDALAALHGHEAARPTPGTGAPWFDHDPPPHAEPLTPRLDSVTLAVSGAAQLVALGGVPPKGVRTWRGLTEGLLASTAIAEALTGEFAVPEPLAALDGTVVPGTGLRFRVARGARTLAEWSDYMGNCIAGSYYLDYAKDGRCVLAGLYDENGVLAANAELLPLRPAARGWRMAELKARFNEPADGELERRFTDWVAAIPGPAADDRAGPGAEEEAPPVRSVRRRRASRPAEETGPSIDALARRVWEETAPAVMETFAAVAGTPADAALVRLRRLGQARLTDACRRALETGAVDLHSLWTAAGVRPLARVVEGLDPAVRERVAPLLADPPLPRSLRELVKRPDVADAYALDLAARGTRRAIGRLACQDAPVIARGIGGRPAEPLLCALTVLITCTAPATDLTPVASPRAVTVPGYPATSLADEHGPWRRAFPLARELGADTEGFWAQIAEHGLRVPASWLGAGGWPALWSRARR